MTACNHVSLIGCALWILCVVAPSAAVASVGGPEVPQASAVVALEEVLTDPVEALTDGLQIQDGFVPIHFDEETGRILLEVTRLDEDFLYAYGLASGLGYPVGVGGAPPELPQLDRGHIESGNQALVHFERHDSRLMLVEKNLAFRALTDDESQRQAVENSFPTSVLGVFPIVESTSPDRYLVDGTDFFLSDVFDVRGRLLSTGVDIRIDRSRSYVDMEYTKAFPKNSEVRAVITFEVDAPSPGLQRLVRDARTFAMEQHHSFVELPPPGYETRKLDPRVGSNPLEFWDFAQPFDGDRYLERYILRWRLEKRDPDAEISEPVEPIVYHLDPAMPEPYRTAIAEGAVWWNEAFERAGFRNAVEVRDLPEGADPMDARYSMILWTHRTGQGSSTGPTLFDPARAEHDGASGGDRALRRDRHPPERAHVAVGEPADPRLPPAPLSPGCGDEVRGRRGLHVCAPRGRPDPDPHLPGCGAAGSPGVDPRGPVTRIPEGARADHDADSTSGARVLLGRPLHPVSDGLGLRRPDPASHTVSPRRRESPSS